MSEVSPNILVDIETAIVKILDDNKIAVTTSFGADLKENTLQEQMKGKANAFGFLTYGGDWKIPQLQSSAIRTFPFFNLIFIARFSTSEMKARHCCYRAIAKAQGLLGNNNLELDIQPLRIGPTDIIVFETYDENKKTKKFQGYAGYGFSIETEVDMTREIAASISNLNEFITLSGSLINAEAQPNASET